MSATKRYLQALRRKQCGEQVDGLDRLRLEAMASNRKTVKSEPKPKIDKETGLYFSAHAWRRISQRGLSVRDVYAIYRHGEPEQDRTHPNRTRYRMTDRAIAEAEGRYRSMLRRLAGEVIVVAPPDKPEHRPLLVTVIAFGRDTR